MAKSKRGYGTSRQVTHFRASASLLPLDRARRLGTKALAEGRKESHMRLLHHLSGLSTQNIQLLNDNIPSHLHQYPDDNVIMGNDTQDGGWEDEAEDVIGNHSADDNTLFDFRDIVSSRWKGRRWYVDHRTWRARRANEFRHWEEVMDPLVDAYLAWQRNPSPPPPTVPSADVPDNYDFEIDVVDLYHLTSSATIRRPPDSISAAVDLTRSGYIGNTPEKPSLAISIPTLELFRVIRLHRPSFSVEAFAKTLCYIYSRPYQRRYRIALSDAFDVYLALRRKVDARVAKLLGRDSPNYRVLNACPACNYELEDEPKLTFRHMIAIDGNNSLKRIKGLVNRNVGDTRCFEDSDYFLSHNFVNTFANEVKAPQQPEDSRGDDYDNTGNNDGDNNGEGDPTDGALGTAPTGCTDKWKAAAADDKKKMWAIFDEAGIFASCCRHGFILWIADMVRSGELAKYPLAIVAKALQVLGACTLFGYDIGCKFKITVDGSSLGPEFASKNCRFCVNAFHGYTHNYLCQLFDHPNTISGMGLEDLETMERVFSASNALGSVTRYMTAYRRRVFIDLHFQQWDADKYFNLATMLYNNYRQAIDIIKTNAQDVADVLMLRNLNEVTLKAYIEDERSFFTTLGKEPDDDLHAMAYVDLLDELQVLENKLNEASSKFLNQAPADYQFISPERSYAQGLSDTRRADTARRSLNDRHIRLLDDITQLEDRMNITKRWTPASPEYQRTAKYICDRKYERALDKLEKLVIQRLFELHKLNLANTGYRARTHIAKSLQSRSKAIRTAVKEVNSAAVLIGQPTLDWEKVSHYSFLDEFNLLRHARADVNKKEWADPVIRETMRRYQRLERAKEEVQRCNIETRRLHTSILDEHHHFDEVLSTLDVTDPLYFAVKDQFTRRRAVNEILLIRISRIYSIPEFSGTREPGIRKGSTTAASLGRATNGIVPHMTPNASLVSGETVLLESESFNPDRHLSESDSDESGDELLGDIGGLVDFVSNHMNAYSLDNLAACDSEIDSENYRTMNVDYTRPRHGLDIGAPPSLNSMAS
ncbi:hypothetical protein H0H93_012292 [Arthromyces matolae]|nr:hypothetical protein H0H93_012292 [Arthromyces matolae]